jgi:hypothetical protein
MPTEFRGPQHSAVSGKDGVLLIIAGAPDLALDWAKQRFIRDRVSVLDVQSRIDRQALPSGWHAVQAADFADLVQLRRDFLSFLDTWPRRAIWRGRSFDELFRRLGGYSVWWTGPARNRHPERGVFPRLNMLWICDRAIRTLEPRRVVLSTNDRDLATLIESRCRSRIDFELVPGSARPRLDVWAGRSLWLGRAAARLPVLPLKYLTRACGVRMAEAMAGARPKQQTEPSIVLVCEWSRDIQVAGDEVEVGFWREVRAALAVRSELPCRYRVVYRKSSWWAHQSWKTLRRLRDVLPPDERYPALAAWWRALPHQFASMVRYARVERTAAFRESFQFAGADVSSLYVPRLRYAVARSIDWAQSVESATRSLRAAGPVAAMLVVKEMYPSELVTIAAARMRRIPTVGVQHGAISPAHLIYTIPPGYVDGSPLPDYFAVYGEFASETVSVHGAYPVERVWVTGGARFDHLVLNPPDKPSARLRLGLPAAARVLLVTTQSYMWFPDVARTILEEARTRPDWFVCVKTHPLRRSHLELYGRLAAESGASNVKVFQHSFHQLLAACDVLISASSTTVLEAILSGRRTICVNFSHEPDPYPYAIDGGSISARSEAELRDALKRVFAPDVQSELERDRRRFLRRHAGPAAEGRAAQTLARMVTELTERNPRAVDSRT